MYQLFVYVLPFSTQGRTWLTDTGGDWSALSQESENETSSSAAARELVSLKEFTNAFTKASFDLGDDLFQKLGLVSHHKKRSIEDRLIQVDRIRCT